MTKPLSEQKSIKAAVITDEYWPFYGLRPAGDPHGLSPLIEVPATFFRRYKRCMREFDAVMQILHDMNQAWFDGKEYTYEP